MLSFFGRLMSPAVRLNNPPDRPGNGVAQNNHEKHDFRFGDNNDQQHRGPEKNSKRFPRQKGHVFEAVILDTADHQQGQKNDENHDKSIVKLAFGTYVIEEYDGGRDNGRRGRNGQAVEYAAFNDADLNVETGQAQGAAEHK